jgi:hypothetical protein
MIRAPTVDHQPKRRGHADAPSSGEFRPKTEPHFTRNAAKYLVACLFLCEPRRELPFACFIAMYLLSSISEPSVRRISPIRSILLLCIVYSSYMDNILYRSPSSFLRHLDFLQLLMDHSVGGRADNAWRGVCCQKGGEMLGKCSLKWSSRSHVHLII